MSVDLEQVVTERSSSPTKRSILSTIAKLFDPMGIASPIMLQAKVLLQEIWTLNLSWDETLPRDVADKWELWCNSLSAVKHISVPRCLSSTSSEYSRFELVGFCDASSYAYAAVVYLFTYSKDKTVSSGLLCSKTRVAPVGKKFTVPRLELLGCLILSKLMDNVSNACTNHLTISRRVFWTDSSINLYRIQGVKKEFKSFVQKRLGKIRQLSEPRDWYYIPTDLNPADVASRGCTADQLIQNELWKHGPEFLRIPDFDFNQFLKKVTNLKFTDELLETAVAPRTADLSLVSSVSHQFVKPLLESCVNLSEFIDIDRYSSLTKLLRITAYVLRFATSRDTISTELSSGEIENAKILWVTCKSSDA